MSIDILSAFESDGKACNISAWGADMPCKTTDTIGASIG